VSIGAGHVPYHSPLKGTRDDKQPTIVVRIRWSIHRPDSDIRSKGQGTSVSSRVTRRNSTGCLRCEIQKGDVSVSKMQTVAPPLRVNSLSR
jgi:hypothetical protein